MRGFAETHRSSTGNHALLPAFNPDPTSQVAPLIPSQSLITWTFGRGSVIWRIWPAVLMHTVFAAAIVTLTIRKVVDLKIPTVMLTVLGVVIGFVISYRASSGYDRYWMGRACWSNVVKNIRAMGRLIWFHVPPRLNPRTPEEILSGKVDRPVGEMKKVMAEKIMALDLLEGFAVALKHHLRGELGIYYEDLYHLVEPLHDHEHTVTNYGATAEIARAIRSSPKAHRRRTEPVPEHTEPSINVISSPTQESAGSNLCFTPQGTPIIPPINAYGTFDPSRLHSLLCSHPPHLERPSFHGSSISSINQHQPLLPSSQRCQDSSLLGKVSSDLIPFAGLLAACRKFFSTSQSHPSPEGDQNTLDPFHSHPKHSWRGPVYFGLHTKHRPYVAGGGNNLPLEILRHLSNWFSVLEDRGTVPGTSLGAMIGTVAAFEDDLTTLERILTTPLPFVYSVHIRTVWLYLFFLPFQLVDQFGWFTIPGVAMAAFIYLGFLAAGEEIEQPFGYDENDLDLDLFCREIVHNDIRHLKSTSCVNAYLESEPEHPAAL